MVNSWNKLPVNALSRTDFIALIIRNNQTVDLSLVCDLLPIELCMGRGELDVTDCHSESDYDSLWHAMLLL